MNTHMVLKPFTGPDNYQFKSGERVNASAWRTVDRLVAHRYLRPLPPESIQGVEQGQEGQRMVEPSVAAAPAPARARTRGKEATDGN